MKAAFTDFELVSETHNTSDIAFIKSILHASEITYFIQGEHVAHFLYHAVPMRVMVKKEQAAEARDILKEMELCFTTYAFKNPAESNNAEE
jgi:hypothetical protein